MDAGMFRGLDGLYNTMLVICIVTIPLGLWKLVEIIVWLFNHVEITAR